MFYPNLEGKRLAKESLDELAQSTMHWNKSLDDWTLSPVSANDGIVGHLTLANVDAKSRPYASADGEQPPPPKHGGGLSAL